MPNISLSDVVMEKLKKYKKKEGAKTYNEAVNLLLKSVENNKKSDD